MRRHISVLGVPVDVVTEEDVVAFARNCIGSGRRAHVVTVNVEYIMRSRTDAEFRRVLTRADLATPDSAGVVWAMRRQGAAVERRVGGSDLVWSLCEQAARCVHRVFLLGAAPGVGKTYEMLQQARARKKDGYDVVVGVVETHGRKETDALLRGIEIIPRRRIGVFRRC